MAEPVIERPSFKKQREARSQGLHTSTLRLGKFLPPPGFACFEGDGRIVVCWYEILNLGMAKIKAEHPALGIDRLLSQLVEHHRLVRIFPRLMSNI